jgi:glycosyltransferase involved in cell wall biosynthesis
MSGNTAGKKTVTFIQRKPRQVGNYSVEFIFNDVRERLKDRIDARILTSKYESAGFFKRLYNCLEARFRQKGIGHVTGDVNYLGLFLSRRRTIHTILDCVFLDGTTGIKHKVLKYFWLTVPVKRSRFLTAISTATKNEILKYASCKPDKIHVIPVAISERFKAVPKVFNATQPRILQVGTAANKNIPRLIEALKDISCILVIIGRKNEAYEQLLKAAGLQYEYRSGLSDEEMMQEYIKADLIAFVSVYEGFGMPILEGQAVGRPVITANLSSMPEVAGDAALLVDPFDVKAVADGIRKIIADEGFRNGLLMKGFENIKRFHPDVIARQYLALYEKI